MLLDELRHIVGKHHVHTGGRSTERFRRGFRFGEGTALAVVQPANLIEQWRVLQAAVAADCIVIMQASNTGLTGGSTPYGTDYDRDVIIINTERMGGIQLLDEGRQVVCLPGATLNELEQRLAPLQREPHSVLGSSCFGASVLGGVCNNSGGALVRRGPVYTEYALYARVQDDGQLHLVNHLGINLGDDPESMLSCLQNAAYTPQDVQHDPQRVASNTVYQNEVRKVDADTPARFNANPDMLFEASGSAGRVVVFAVRLDTFAREESDVFYIGSNDPDDLTHIRRYLLTQLPNLPIAGEYIHRTAFDIGEKYGKDAFLFIQHFGTGRVRAAYARKSRLDTLLGRIGLPHLTDQCLQGLTRLLPRHLPAFMYRFRDQYEHHLLLRIVRADAPRVQDWLQDYFTQHVGGAFHVCSESEGTKAFLQRFVVASAAVRYRDTHKRSAQDVVALDIALRRNDEDWVETLPPQMQQDTVHILYYGHFMCHVFHQDYIVKKGVDPVAYEHALWKVLDARGAEYPAEHNVGHLYHAKPALAKFYHELDPTNSFNPGIGQTVKTRNWQR